MALKVQGVLSVRHGDVAILVRSPTEEHAIRTLWKHAEWALDAIEARQALEVKLYGLAAVCRTDAEVAAIDAAIPQMDSENEAAEGRNRRRDIPRGDHRGGDTSCWGPNSRARSEV